MGERREPFGFGALTAFEIEAARRRETIAADRNAGLPHRRAAAFRGWKRFSRPVLGHLPVALADLARLLAIR